MPICRSCEHFVLSMRAKFTLGDNQPPPTWRSLNVFWPLYSPSADQPIRQPIEPIGPIDFEPIEPIDFEPIGPIEPIGPKVARKWPRGINTEMVTKIVPVRAVDLSIGPSCTEFRCERFCDDDVFGIGVGNMLWFRFVL